MKQSEIWYIDERAEQLAIVYLTRRDDLTIMPAYKDDTGLDYLVRIRTPDPQAKHIFGVRVNGVLARSALPHYTDHAPEVNPMMSRAESLQSAEIPVCTLLFVMETDEGFYRWVQEPIITPAGIATLQSSSDAAFKPLDTDALARIVARVNQWYGAAHQA